MWGHNLEGLKEFVESKGGKEKEMNDKYDTIKKEMSNKCTSRESIFCSNYSRTINSMVS